MGSRTALLGLVPFLAVAGNFSGTTVDLAGSPIPGIVVRSTFSGSTVSDDQGRWLLGSAGLLRSSGFPVAKGSHLGVRAGRLSLSWDGFDVVGRGPGAATGKQPGVPFSRGMAGSPDTLVVVWNGKRLARLPVASDSAPIVFRMDTSWADDGGIGWNPKVAYGSLKDERDGAVYRTVQIATQTWMAENLNYAPSDGVYWCDDAANCAFYHNLYSWSAAMGLDRGYDTARWSGGDVRHRGICPTEWHLPSDSEWNTLKNTLLNTLNGTGVKLKSAQGWSLSGVRPGGGTDDLGFRAVPGGNYESQAFNDIGRSAFFWSSTQVSGRRAWYRSLSCCATGLMNDTLYSSGSGFSARCVKN